ncbi:hypothetical protein PR048_006758 [Dryococelus australis]|uniref:Uncharacterized protein n=1 Tax=Dryococelus australis TaxID=614101 RepID=A0ABQ9IBW4_9NEOP|nr:hypothetical protein PR048_006758 [Dryococelus australis]
MRVKRRSMKQRRNKRAGEKGEPQENPPTSGIVRCGPHLSITADHDNLLEHKAKMAGSTSYDARYTSKRPGVVCSRTASVRGTDDLLTHMRYQLQPATQLIFTKKMFTKHACYSYQGACCSQPLVSGVKTSEECSGLLTSFLSTLLGVRPTFQIKTKERNGRRGKRPGGKSATANIRTVKSTTAGWTIGLDATLKFLKSVMTIPASKAGKWSFSGLKRPDDELAFDDKTAEIKFCEHSTYPQDAAVALELDKAAHSR